MKEIIIVTGGASGLGLELCNRLISKGYLVCSIDRKQQKTIDNLKCFCGDISDEVFIKNTVIEIAKLGTVKAVINNAGVGIFKKPKENTKAILDELYKGVYGMILLTTNILPYLEKDGGKVINIMSSAALRGNAGGNKCQ